VGREHNMTKQKGFLVIFALIFIAVLLMSILGLGRLFVLYSQTVDLRYKRLKAYYLAESGWAIAKENFAVIRTLSVPSSSQKEWIYANINNATRIDLGTEESKLYLLKSEASLYSAGIVQDKYRVILKVDFEQNGENLKFKNWEEIDE
jgi:hypothetical protein